jgi:hypothetical protein
LKYIDENQMISHCLDQTFAHDIMKGKDRTILDPEKMKDDQLSHYTHSNTYLDTTTNERSKS